MDKCTYSEENETKEFVCETQTNRLDAEEAARSDSGEP